MELTEDFPTGDVARSLIERAPGVSLYLGCEGFQELVEAQRGRAVAICAHHGGKDLGEAAAHTFWNSRHRTAERFQQDRLQNLPHGILDTRPEASFDYIHVAFPPHESCAIAKLLWTCASPRDHGDPVRHLDAP